MEDALGAVLQAGLTEADFWTSTPYLTRLAVQAAARRESDRCLVTGWWSARFSIDAQSKSGLKPLAHYLDEKSEDEVNPAAAMRDWAARNDAKFKRG